MSPATVNSYDEVPYESNPFSQTHPNRLAAVGTLFGMRPAAVHNCRVIELGCAAGGNLIPMAVQLPESRFLGVDLSARQIAEGQQVVDRLGLKNIELRHASIVDVNESDGRFDYLICHGVFSWVPQEVQEAIFRIANCQLNPQGIAFISYNTFPGWHMRGLIREMMRYHAANYATPQIRTRQARGLLDFLVGSVAQDGSAFSSLLRQEAEVLRRHADHYLYHEHLEDLNAPLFFHQFVEQAGAQRLQYLGEATVRTMMVGNMPEGVQQALRVMATDQIQIEQYMDFLRNRTFRETLLCHASIRLDRSLNVDPIRRLWITSRDEMPKEPISLAAGQEVAYRSPGGFTLRTAMPLMKAALARLREARPRALSFDDLYTNAVERLRPHPDVTVAPEDRTTLASHLLQSFIGSDLIELSGGPMAFINSVSQRPEACPYARDQATLGIKVTNRRHETVGLNPIQHALLPVLDGKSDREALLGMLTEIVEKDRLAIRDGDREVTETHEIRTILSNGLMASLEDFKLAALLIR